MNLVGEKAQEQKSFLLYKGFVQPVDSFLSLAARVCLGNNLLT